MRARRREDYGRCLADGLIVSGEATGLPPKTSDLERVRLAVPDVPLLVGSGASPENAADLLALADCLIVRAPDAPALPQGASVRIVPLDRG